MINKTLIAISLFVLLKTNAQDYTTAKSPKLDFQSFQIFKPVNIPTNIKFAKSPKNVIILIGDGMGTSQIFSGITANRGNLNIMNFPYSGFSMTQSADNYITDSAAGGTAISSGVRTRNGAIGVDTLGKPVKTLLEIGEAWEKSTGLVATSTITHATPASFIAHQASRKDEESIAEDFLKTDVDVFIGGGASYFNKRNDKVDLTTRLKENGYSVVYGIDSICADKNKKLAGFTSSGPNEPFEKRAEVLPRATEKAISILKTNKKGFFLMVEGSQIDWAGHQNDLPYMVNEMIDFDKAIGEALKFAIADKNTLVIVTADHETGGLSLIGGDMDSGTIKAKFALTNHTAVMVPVFAIGPGAENFGGIYKNTEIFSRIMKLWK